ncbi:hypothetical protein [Streptomyces sp. NPDC055105]|uniref:hypothetical protein n=1 Tax=Streptomyces sp. NPDC055105 TaxID=3365719 RepID=UPI0037D2C3F5
MEDPEQQDSDEDAEPDNAEAEATGGVRPFVHPLLRNYDPLGPLRVQIASINRTLRNPVLDAMARNNAFNTASAVAAMAAQQRSFLNSVQVATGPPTGVKIALDGLAAMAAQQRSFLNSVQVATGPPTGVKIALDGLAAMAAQQRSMVDSALATAWPTLSILGSSVRSFERNWVSSHISPLSSLVLQANSFQSSLHQIAGTISRVFTEDLFSRFDTLRGLFREWLPDNLRDVDAGLWMWLLRISAKDGTCLAWAPRAEIVAELLALRRSEDRQRCMMEHRPEVVEDVETSLKKVDHPDLLDLRELTLQAAACISDGHDAPAQALLANVLDTVMRAHGHTWLRSYFPQAPFPPNPNTGSHKMIAGAHGTYSGSAQLRMLGPYLLVNAMKNVFSGVDRQHTLNRHLGAHKASSDSYRSEFAFAALLNTQALLRLVDRYLYA